MLQAPVDEQCHEWLVQLLTNQRVSWEGASVRDLEREIEELEAASQGQGGGAETAPASPAPSSSTAASSSAAAAPCPEGLGLAHELAELPRRRRDARAAYRAWDLRAALAHDMATVAARYEEDARTRAISARYI